MATRRSASGFTTAELIIVVLIIAILGALAGPDMMQLIRRQRVKTATFDLFSSLNLARSEAIKRNLVITMAPIGGDWSKGWRITDSNEQPIRQQSGWSNLSMTGPASVRFNASGRVPPASGAASFSVTSPDVPPTSYRCVRLDLSGRAVSQEGPCL